MYGYVCIFVYYMSAIAGQTAGPNGLTFFLASYHINLT